ncbi:hypothetical protein IGI04_016878 [Brassica rapa subsp. trilocularis]|uniref:Uncharacterized protein n=1 Tax=Brassica rapa subsp. trilocularis TaxID=1813537 RepID=A0ABQ7MU89_BRACM|nr:hypothetical protein IGI04_016878 [Brassica rapa subsp. trilocularis]
MKKKKPKKSKSPASKSASKASPSKDSPVKSVDYDSDSPHSEFVSDAHNDIPVDVVAQLPLVSSDLDSPPVPPSDQAVIVDSLTDPSGKTEVDLPMVSSSDKTVIADPSADPSSVQEVIPMILLESSSVIQATCSSVLPSNSLQTTNDGSYLEPAVQAPIAEDEKKSSCSHLAEAIDNTVTPSVVPEEGETRGRKTRRSKSRGKQKWVVATPPIPSQQQDQADKLGTDGILVSHKGDPHIQNCHLELSLQTKLGTREDKAVGESSGARATPPEDTPHLKAALQRSGSRSSHASHSDVQPDSSDVESSDPELEEGEFSC